MVVVAALGGLTACRSTPSARRVAFDVIDTLPVEEPVKECMRAKVEGYSQDDIEAFAKGADQNPPDAEAQAALDQFEADLESCNASS